ncbi:HU family DNA-binding protein [Lederbergia lenta]|uniref:HU family DNA-binding protein n=1 Tax=Lederbergia lenta TaxID=1467 RepID=UPI00203ADF7C|nr:HU family DNA-binding protein [Lederbergia lenta]MCM3110017.1 HU family DNA-binding protein [Lederbergia lenta]
MQDSEVLAEKGVKLNQEDAKALVDEVLGGIVELTVNHGKLSLDKFGIYEVRERAARKGRNPSTGEEILIAASKAFKFSPAKAVKDTVKQLV